MLSNSDQVVSLINKVDLNVLLRLELVVTRLVGVTMNQCRLLTKLEHVV
ncbi:MAG: hypothetical protein ACJAWQ_002242 [Paraglaciecola sp.]|jgi:hypothetical protein